MGDSKQQVITRKLEQKPLESKKALYGLYTGICVLVVFAVSAFLILRHAEEAKNIVELASLTIMFFGAIATTLITGQAAMDWRAISALQHVETHESQDIREQVQTTQDTKITSNQALPGVCISSVRSPKDFHRDKPF